MSATRSGTALFLVGAVLLLFHTALPFVWELVGLPSTRLLESGDGLWALVPAITTSLGGLLLVVGGLLYGREARR